MPLRRCCQLRMILAATTGWHNQALERPRAAGDNSMNPLSGLDASFLYLESPEMPMHVGSFCLYELPVGRKGSWHQAVRAHIARRLHLAAIFNHRLGFMPLDLGHPVW